MWLWFWPLSCSMGLTIVLATSEAENSDMFVDDQHVVANVSAEAWYQARTTLFEILMSGQGAATDFWK